jgi:hypothetical protein
MMDKRIVVVVEPLRTRSWDHRKLGIDTEPASAPTH